MGSMMASKIIKVFTNSEKSIIFYRPPEKNFLYFSMSCQCFYPLKKFSLFVNDKLDFSHHQNYIVNRTKYNFVFVFYPESSLQNSYMPALDYSCENCSSE